MDTFNLPHEESRKAVSGVVSGASNVTMPSE